MTKEYVDHLLERIWEIRLSECQFYQKITDIYATALDYGSNTATTISFCQRAEQAPLGHPLAQRAGRENPKV